MADTFINNLLLIRVVPPDKITDQSLFCHFCGIFASIDIKTGAIITNGFDELGHEYKCHPDSNVRFKDFVVPIWDELLEEAKQAYLSEKQTYEVFVFALSVKGWVIVEANWGDLVLQQTALKRGLKTEFVYRC